MTRVRLAWVAIAVAILGCSAAAGAAEDKPVISGLSATPASVASGGTTAVSASVSGASECTLSSKPSSVSGLPATFACEGGFSRELVMPVDGSHKPLKYKLTLVATGPSGTAKAQAAITVGLVGVGQSVAAGSSHTCSLLVDGQVDCWGLNEHGELGDGTTTNTDAPGEVLGLTGATQVAAGGSGTPGESCALLSSGHVDCWGENEFGQLGDGTTMTTDVPSEVLGITDAVQVSIGGAHACAVLSSGHVDCWGSGAFGELGDGGETSTEVPVEVLGVTDAVEVSPNSNHTCARLSTGKIECWGGNSRGELGDGTTTNTSVPAEVLGITDAMQVSAGLAATCAELDTGHVECWGDGDRGELGDGSEADADAPAEVTGLSDAVGVSTGHFFACAALATGGVDCWGEDHDGELGIGALAGVALSPVEVHDIADATQVTAGGEQACALLSTRHIDCWGRNDFGQLGDGNHKKASSVPAEVSGI